jgi:hypothetical protein
MKVWVGLSVLCLVWSASVELSDWKTYLLAIDPTLPYTTPTDGKICYYFDIAQTCSGDAISTLLGLPTPTDIPNWTSSAADCDALLDGQRVYAEKVAADLFAESLLLTLTNGMSGYELMVQSWVLRIGHYRLSQDYGDLLSGLSALPNFENVRCEGSDLRLYLDIIPQPDFFTAKDCEVISSGYD